MTKKLKQREITRQTKEVNTRSEKVTVIAKIIKFHNRKMSNERAIDIAYQILTAIEEADDTL
jgi:ribonuclease HI